MLVAFFFLFFCADVIALNIYLVQKMKHIKSDKSRMVLTADKGVALVVIDTVDYIKKAKEILEDTNTYRVIHTDPTSRLKTN